MNDDRLPPHNLEAEEGVLGAILLESWAIDEIIPILQVEDFYRDSHQVLYRAMVAARNEGVSIDALSMADRLPPQDPASTPKAAQEPPASPDAVQDTQDAGGAFLSLLGGQDEAVGVAGERGASGTHPAGERTMSRSASSSAI